MGSQRSHLIRNTLILIGVVSIVAAIGFGGIEITCTPWFCNRCHEMNVYYDTWEICNHSSRGDCMQCHVREGFINFLKAKANGVFSLIFHVLGYQHVEATLPVVCLREGCHVLENIDTVERKREYVKTVKMDHSAHVDLIRRIGTRYDCIPCHKNIAHSKKRAFMPDMKDTCFICHSDLDIRYQNCIACHPGHPLIEGEVEELYEIHHEAGIGCEGCHIDAHKANAVSCINCHDESYAEYTSFKIKE